MNKSLATLAVLGCAVASQATVIFQDGFETGDFSKWAGLTGASGEQGSVQSAVVYEGNYAAGMTATTGATINGRYANITPTASSETVTVDFYMKLGGTSSNNRHYLEIRSYTGNAYGTGTLEQLIAIGCTNQATNKIDAAGNITTSSNMSKWQARAAFSGYTTNNGWFVLDQAANRTTDWTKFSIEISPTTLQFYVDGVAGLATPISRGNTGSLDCIVISARLPSASNTGYFDNINISTAAVPEPMTIIGLATGLGALVARRRRNK